MMGTKIQYVGKGVVIRNIGIDPGIRRMRIFSKHQQSDKEKYVIILLFLISVMLSFSLNPVFGQGTVTVSDNLNNFIEGIKIIQRNGTDTETNPGVANPGDRVKLRLTFLEDDDNQLDMDDLHVLRFKLPDTFMCDDGYTTTVDIYFNDSGTLKNHSKQSCCLRSRRRH